MSETTSKNLNSKYAWQELTHQGLPKRSASERAADFMEIYGLYDEETAREQASRCIQCPNPTCVAGCPLCNPIPQWLQLTAEGRFLEAAGLLGSVTNMAEICTRLCPTDHLCEGACLLEAMTEPVSIQAIEQFLMEYAFAHGHMDTSTAPPNGLKVAVVGSGPGGLACAEELAKKGFAVTIFDSDLVPGGLLVNGTPAFKLDDSIVERRIQILKRRGIVFRLGVKLSQDVTLSELREKFDAVYLGWDSRKARPLDVAGAEFRGVVPAVTFLLQKKTPIALDLPRIEVVGKRVVVIGGGDTAMDCVRAAIRYGAEDVLCVYRRDQQDMPCGRHEYENAVEEGARFMFCAAPVAVLSDRRGQVSGLRLIRTEMGPADKAGRRSFTCIAGTKFNLEADLVIPALGFDPLPCPDTEDFRELALNQPGRLVVNDALMTSLPGVFAGGDLVKGPSLVLHAVRDARLAAGQIANYLASSRHTRPER